MNINYFKYFLGFSLIIILFSCSNSNDGATDPLGITDYFIDNQTSEILIYSIDNSIDIMPSEIEVIHSSGSLGTTYPIEPSYGLESLVLFRNDNGTLITALEIDPIIDSQWNEEIISNDHSKFTLIVTDEMIE